MRLCETARLTARLPMPNPLMPLIKMAHAMVRPLPLSIPNSPFILIPLPKPKLQDHGQRRLVTAPPR